MRALIVLLLGIGALQAAAVQDPDRDPEAIDALRIGRQIYEEGLAASGQPLRGQLSQGLPVEGSSAACISCHRRSGQGALEGQILIPPVTAPTLFRDGIFAEPGDGPLSERAGLRAHYQTRHAYQPETLNRALAQGLDPEGRTLLDPMPRYDLDAREQQGLHAYLARLGRDAAVAQGQPASFWLVLGTDAREERRRAVRAVVEAFAADLPGGGPAWRLRVIDLAADARALDAALAESTQRPLALLSGAGAADWSSVEAVCERERIPCVFPSLAALAPAKAAAGRRFYTQYWSEGLVLEARALAELVHADPALACRAPVILVAARQRGQPAQPVSGSGDGPAVEAAASDAGLAALRAALPEAQLFEMQAGSLGTPADCAVAWMTGVEVNALLDSAARPAEATRWRLPFGLQPIRGVRPPALWVGHLEYVTALDPEAPLRFRAGLEPWLARHQLLGLDQRAAADALGACTLTLAALGAMEGERVRGMRIGPVTRDEFVEALEHVTNRQRLPGVEHYSPVVLGGISRVASRTASVLAYPGPAAPEPRLVRRLVPR